MTNRVITTRPDAPIAEAAQLLTEHGFTALPVVDEQGELAGIITEADLIHQRFDGEQVPGAPQRIPETVAEVMTTPLIGVSQDADVAVVVEQMLTNKRRCVPIIDGNTLVGVITRRDVVRVLARSDEETATDVRKHLLYLGGSSRWMVQVVNGEAHLRDNFQDSPTGSWPWPSPRQFPASFGRPQYRATRTPGQGAPVPRHP